MKGAISTAALSKPLVMHFNLILTADKKLHVEILLQKQCQQGSGGGYSGSHCYDTGNISAAICGVSQHREIVITLANNTQISIHNSNPNPNPDR